MPEWNYSRDRRVVPPLSEGLAFTPESVEAAEGRVSRRRRLRLMLHHIAEAKCLLPLVQDLDCEQLDAMLALVTNKHTPTDPTASRNDTPTR